MRSIEERNALVEEHLDLAEHLARLRHRSVHRTVQLGELLSAAYEGLLDAANKFDTNKVNAKAKYPFRCYARTRITGEMNDYLRSCNWGTRGKHRKAHSIDTVPGYYDDGGQVVTLREVLPARERPAIDELNGRELFNKLIRSLPKREKMVFKLRFLNSLTMKEVAKVVGISESRVSQILSQNKLFLKDVWGSKLYELWDEVKVTK